MPDRALTRLVPFTAAACCLLFPLTIGQGPNARGSSVRGWNPAGPQPSLEVVVDGVMAPVVARITLSCVEAGGGKATHMVGFGADDDYDIVEQAPIDVSRTFRHTTEVRGLCRDDRGSIRRVLPRTVLVVDAAGQRDSVIALSNEAREIAGLGSLSADSALDVVARAHAQDMAERKYFDHVTPEGKDLAQRLKDSGITFVTAGENIGGNASAAAVVRAWLNSDGHRRNLLDPEFARIGIGIYRTPSSPYTYYVQVLAR